MPSHGITKEERHTVNVSVDTFLLLTQDAVYFNTIANFRLVNSKMLKSIRKNQQTTQSQSSNGKIIISDNVK